MTISEARRSQIGFSYCRRCKTNKPVEDFSSIVSDDGTESILSSVCTECTLDKAKQQITRPLPDEQYREAFKRQEGKCAICGRPPGVNHRLATDHCHKTGIFRGLICERCNWSIGLMGDNSERFVAAAQYLKNGGTCSDMKFDMSVREDGQYSGKRLTVLRKK